MLSRSAQGLYWTGRYLERAEHLCRLMAHQIEALGDCSIEMIDRRWQRLYASIRREPVAGKLEPSPEDDAYIFADAYTLADDLTFEPQNPDSIGACVANARENIRQVRNAVSREMWGSLNTAYLELHTRRIEDIWVDRTEEFYKRTENAVRTFIGVADSTMYRDDSWSFFQLGRFLERAQLVAVLLDAHLEIYSTDQPDTESDWESLLSICLARGAFRRLHSLNYQPDRVVDFLVSDACLVHSVRYALTRIEQELEAVTGPNAIPPAVEAHRRTRRMAARLDYDWPQYTPGRDSESRSMLVEIRDTCHSLHADIDGAYFHYGIEDTPIR